MERDEIKAKAHNNTKGKLTRSVKLIKKKMIKTDVTDIGLNMFGENNNLLALG